MPPSGDATSKANATFPAHRALLATAVPIILSNLSTPLLGVVDTAIVGQIDDPIYLGAVALGATIFSFLFWGFGFLRMGTSGLTAQATGAGDTPEISATLARAALIAGACGLGLIALQYPLAKAAFWLIQATGEVEAVTAEYFSIRIWSAPAALANYAILGWFIGLGRADKALILQIVMNGANILLDMFFVLHLDMRADGVALGTAMAEYMALALGIWLVAGSLRRRAASFVWDRIVNAEQLIRTMSVNRDIMIRSLCLIFSFSWFTAQGAIFGDATLAANGVLRNFLMTSAFLLDGFAFAAETQTGQAVGARRYDRFAATVRISFIWAGVLSLVLFAASLVIGEAAIAFMTVNQEVRALSLAYLPWVAAAPLIGFPCYLFDGIFIGATRTADMRNMMIASTGVYLAAWYVLTPQYGNHGLWAALLIFFVARGISLGLRYRPLVAASFGARRS